MIALSACAPQEGHPVRELWTPPDAGLSDDAAFSLEDSGRDTDRDGILDRDEGTLDWDRDGVSDDRDTDSDDDGIPDAAEAGDTDPRTLPVDTDQDLIPDFRDLDSDDDGLSDHDEARVGTSPTRADSDGDSVPDAVEYEACAGHVGACAGDATDPHASPRTRGGFYFYVPYDAEPTPERDTLDFQTDLRRADIYFLMDTTGSMQTSIDRVSESVTRVASLVRERIPDALFGLGEYRDYPEIACIPSDIPGSRRPLFCLQSDDFPYRHLVSITRDLSRLQTTLAGLVADGGGHGDLPESAAPAMWATLTRGRLSWPEVAVETNGGRTRFPAGQTTGPAFCGLAADGAWGSPCFRPDAIPIIVNITDAASHNGSDPFFDYTDAFPEAPTYAQTMAAVVAHRALILGIDTSGRGDARRDLEDMARRSGAVVDGRPLVYSTDFDGSGLGDQIVEGIRAVSGIPLDVSVEFRDDPADAVDTWTAFVRAVEPHETGDTERGCAPRAAVDRDGDGNADTFERVIPGQPVCFDVRSKRNETVPSLESGPQIFHATLQISGNGYTPLGTRDVFFFVPRRVLQPSAPR